MVLTCALAICASSSRASTSAAVSDAKALTISVRKAMRLALRFALPAKRGSVASAGCSSTLAQKAIHSRSFCRPSITVLPSPAGKGP